MSAELNQSQLAKLVNKRLTANLLIQGAAHQAFYTAHYLITDELKSLDPKLIKLYDQFAVCAALMYYIGIDRLVHGSPKRFWRKAATPGHYFEKHPLLSTRGQQLASEELQYARQRSREKRVTRIPIVFSYQVPIIYQRILLIEFGNKQLIEYLARKAVSRIWNIPPKMLHAEITRTPAFGQLRKPTTFSGNALRNTAIGYGGVLQVGDELQVIGKASCWPVLIHELVKAVAELICLHGFNELDPETWNEVQTKADLIEHEPWMLQAGPALWRKILALRPLDSSIAHILMNMMLLPPDDLESLMFDVIDTPDRARHRIRSLT